MNWDKIKLFIFLLAVIGLLLFFSRFSFFSKLIDIVVTPVRPIQASLFGGASQINKFLGDLFLARELEKSNKILTERVINLSKQNVHLNELQSENLNLRKLLDFKRENVELDIIVAKVLSKSAIEPTVIQIDKGAYNNLKIGQAIISHQGILIGKLTRVDQFSSLVMLLTDSRSEVSGAIASMDRPVGIVTGEKGLSIRLDLIPNDENIKKGDLVVTSGLEELIPGGLIIGEVEEIKREANELFQQAILKTLISIKNVSLVAVVQK